MKPPALMVSASLLAFGCYHFSFEQNSERPQAPAKPEVTYKIRRPTYINGFVGTGRVDTSRYCEEPVRTELRVTATDVLLSVVTLLIYTPHTLYVTCERGAPAREQVAAVRQGSGSASTGLKRVE